MKKTAHFFVALIMTLGVSMTASEHARASFVKDFFDDIWVQTTSPRVFEGQRRGGLIGGSIVARIPNRTYSVISMSAPRFEAGCGGIDLNAGSYAFINGDELINLFKQIGQQAKALLFKIAVDSINAMLGGLLTEFQQKVQAMNSLLGNTCAIAQGVVDYLDPRKKIEEGQGELSKRYNTFKGILTDWDGTREAYKDGVASVKKMWTVKSGETSSTSDDPLADVTTRAGNITWRAAISSPHISRAMYSAGKSGVNNLNKGTAALLVIAVGGTEILDFVNGVETDDEQKRASECMRKSGDACEQDFIRQIPGNLSVANLYDPAEHTISACTDAGALGDREDRDWKRWMVDATGKTNECTKMETIRLSQMFAGTSFYTNALLWGVPKAGKLAETERSENKGLVAYLKGHNDALNIGNGLNIPDMLANIDTPILSILRRVQRDPAALNHVASTVEDALGVREAIKMGEDILSAAKSIYPNRGGLEAPKDYSVSVAVFETSLNSMKEETQHNRWFETINSMVMFSNNVASSLARSPVAAAGSGQR